MNGRVIFLQPIKAVQSIVIIIFIAVPDALLDVVRVSFTFHYQLLLLSLVPLFLELYHCLFVLGVTPILTDIWAIVSPRYFVFLLLLSIRVGRLIVIGARSGVEICLLLGTNELPFLNPLFFAHVQ